MSTTTEELDALRRDHGARWEIWIVPLAVEKGFIWCARLHTDHSTIVNARVPAHLAEYITGAEADGQA